jgi:type I restriction enzyme S subunit
MKIQTTKTEFKKISELCDLRKGKKVNSSSMKTKNSVPYLLIDTLRGAEPEFFTEDKNYTEAIPEDILIVADGANSGLVGTGVKGAVGSTILRIRINVNDLNKDYLSYFLKSKFQEFNKDMKGTGIPHLKPLKMLELEIRKPSPGTQSLIVSAIESNFSKIDNAIKNLKSAKKKIGLYRKAVLKKAFEKGEDWDEKNIGDVFITNPQKSEIKDLSDDLDISFIPMKFVSEKSKKIINQETKKLFQVRKGYTYFKENDVILAKITPCFENGKMAIAKELKNGIGFGSTEYHVFRFEKEVITPFLFYFLQQNKFKGEAKRNMTGTAGQLRVPMKFIENFPIAFPSSLPTQQKIVSSIESKFSVIDKVEEAVNNSLAKSEKLKKSILKSAFEGRLVGEEEENRMITE